MKRIIHFFILAGVLCISGVACRKDTAVDDFIVFGELNISNKTTYNNLAVQLEGVDKQLPVSEVKLKPGPNQLKVWGLSGNPKDKPVAIFDTLLNVTAKNIYNFVLFQLNTNDKPVVIINNQTDEAKPEAGFMKIKMANFASHCFPGKIDVLMKMMDYNYGDLVDLDVIKQVQSGFGSFGKYKTFDPIMSDGSIIFYVVDPVTQQPLHRDFILGVDIMNYAGQRFYNVITLYMTEKESSRGNFTGDDGKKYEVEVKSLFLN
ncbi:hypothetical protein [Chitinophaga nivalis]|uniref:DUF4843 domain-containing protein n=1 Tax=Chitinophaga nivalis TaxID=2991709 RepID=A0ABT3IFF1_9BACT|nr:hypothetical protein [Chitinophaga nivalis]MCW3467618.1 hypothetical protein [Chitinophaga nivalis]MCW3482690.1 hypothetical protein [Chitinophaga nivalis]